jgi:hypothetical protein
MWSVAPSSITRRPAGYVGTRHETIGSDILAVYEALVAISPGSAQRLANQTIGEAYVEQLAKVKPDGWYPIAWLLELMDRVDAKLGRYALMRMGRVLFQLSHEGKAPIKSGRDVVYGIDAMYRAANRGDGIGGWRVVEFERDRAVLEKTTPHHCAMEEGILLQAFTSVKSPAVITQARCFRDGHPLCEFHVLPSSSGPAWTG